MKSKILIAGLAALSLSACTSINPYTGQSQLSSTTGGALIGAGGGAVVGGIIGAATGADPRVAALEREKDVIESRLDSLRRRKTAMDSTAYDKALEDLLVQLAEKNKAIRDATGGRP